MTFGCKHFPSECDQCKAKRLRETVVQMMDEGAPDAIEIERTKARLTNMLIRCNDRPDDERALTLLKAEGDVFLTWRDLRNLWRLT